MSKDVSVWIDPAGGAYVLQVMSRAIAQELGQKIANRASYTAAAMDDDAPTFKAETKVGTIKRGSRAICTVQAETTNARQLYVARMALTKSKDAGII